jgi:antitoxin (DNA-binding transcriptional repressor) of toxin-antitoxin stability system
VGAGLDRAAVDPPESRTQGSGKREHVAARAAPEAKFRVDTVTTGDYFWDMKAVGVKQLKARLSEYVRLVKAGETILVTDRDEVVAELRPARRQRRTGGDLEEVLQGLADTGELTRASVPKLDWTWRVKGLGLPAGTAQRVLDEVRSDRPPVDA